jgi:hypothetical protein
MITQLLGVALISLLMITPTIQQNNIEQLIVPNIEITTSTFNSPDPNRLWVANQFSYYNTNNHVVSPIDSTLYKNNFNQFIYNVADVTYEFSNITRLIYVTNNNFYIYRTDVRSITAQAIKELVELAYTTNNNGATISSSLFSFTLNNDILSPTITYYTYQINGSAGQVNARIYIINQSNLSNISNISINTNISLPANSTLQQVINWLNPQVTWTYSDNRYDQKILYYWLDTPLLNSQGTYTRTLYGRDNYGYYRDFGSFTLNLTQADTTPPTITSITGNSINWTNQNVILTVQANDNLALNSQAYSFDNGFTYQTSNSKTFTTNEIVNIKVRDSSNNETSQQVIINRIDKQSPSINLASNWKNTFELGELTSNNDLYNYLSISDGESGINTSLTTISNFNYNQAGTYTNVQVSTTDNAGNNFVYTLPTINIIEQTDNTPPTISGSTSITRQQGNITTQDILSNFTISDPSGIAETRIQRLDNSIVTSWNDFTIGTYQLRVYVRDTVGNIALYQFELIVTATPIPDTTPPVITGSLLTSFVIGTYTSTSEILALYTITDNVAVGVSQVLGIIDFEQLGDYPVTISATDTSNNTTILNIVVRIRADVVLGNYNPLTDLLSGIFGAALSMIFTIGTINVLGLRLLDAMGVIILGAVLLFVYKAIKGGS